MTQKEMTLGGRKFRVVHEVGNWSKPPNRDKSVIRNDDGWPILWDTPRKDPGIEMYNIVSCAIVPDLYVAESLFQGSPRLGYQFHNFPIYVNEGEKFMSNFDEILTTWSRTTDVPIGDHHKTNKLNFKFKGLTISKAAYIYPDIRLASFNYEEDTHFAAIFGMFVASYLCGVSKELLDDRSVNNVTKSFIRYHLYFQVRKFMQNPSLLSDNRYVGYIETIRSRLPFTFVNDSDKSLPCIEYGKKDYLSMLSYRSYGITDEIGLSLLQESIQSYVYCIVGAQTLNRSKIVGNGASSLTAQDTFRELVEKNIGSPDPTGVRSSMREAMKEAQVVCNLAVTPGIEMAPSNLQMSDVKIPGYNDVLVEATTEMNFGTNKVRGYDSEERHIFAKPDKAVASTLISHDDEKGPVVHDTVLRGEDFDATKLLEPGTVAILKHDDDEGNDNPVSVDNTMRGKVEPETDADDSEETKKVPEETKEEPKEEPTPKEEPKPEKDGTNELGSISDGRFGKYAAPILVASAAVAAAIGYYIL